MSVRLILFLTIATLFSEIIFGSDSRLDWSSIDTVANVQIDTQLTSNIDTLLVDSISTTIPIDTTITSYFTDQDSLLNDTLLSIDKQKSSPLADKVTYNSTDSMIFILDEHKVLLYGAAKVNYQNIELKAEFIEIDFGKEEVFAKGLPDTLGEVIGKPEFSQDDQIFNSDSMRYNFNTESGIIYHIITQEGEGYLHSEKTKRHANKHIHMENGKYTTCDAEHPHFYLALTKGIVIPEDKIVTSLAYLVVADIPFKFIGIPFGFFPNTTSRTSGVLIPSYGEEQRRGFYLRDFGWYQVLGEHADLSMQGDWYQKGSWAIRNRLSYKWRYHFSGNFGFNIAEFKDNQDESVQPRKDYSLRWTHRQDAKANPTQNFSASVNFSSQQYDQNHSYSSSQYLNTSTNSSISYTKRWPGTPFNLSLSANANQNRQTETVNLSLPTGSFNMSTIYPLRRKNGTGKYKWYENMGLSYSSNFKSILETYTEVLTEKATWDSLQTGFSHAVPLSVNFKIGKLLTISPSMNYKGNIYTHHIEIDKVVEYDSVSGKYVENVTEFDDITYEHAFNPTIGVSFTPKMYGMLTSTKEDSYVEAIRHVLSPSVSASFTPDMNEFNNTSYYDTLKTVDGGSHRVYSKYEDELYTPPSSNGKSGSVRFALNNNLEMKVRPKNDTTGESKKVKILDNFNLSTSYNPFAEKYKWSDVRLTTGTKLFNSKLDIRMNGSFSPYGLDTAGNKVNESYFNQKNKLLRFTNMSISSGFSLRSQQSKDKEEGESEDKFENEERLYDEYIDGDMDYQQGFSADSYVDFEIPWSLNVRHSWSINKSRGGDPVISNTLNLSGDVSITPAWKIGGQMNYDLEQMEMSYTSLNIYRDLHCWEMRFTVVPFGTRKSYSFTIQAKGSLLSDLKHKQESSWFDRL